MYKNYLAEIELKFKRDKSITVTKITNSQSAFELFKKFYNEDTVELCESVIVLFLDSQHKTLGWFKMSSGGLNASIIDIRLILATALKVGATGIMASHNHPPGNTRPSIQDDAMTVKLKNGCDMLDIQLTDHIIVAGDLERYYSYADEGKI